MSMALFAVLFPKLARAESRSIIVASRGATKLGDAECEEYGLLELYCTEPGCDCRRVLFNVMSKNQDRQVATINHAFEPPRNHAIVKEQTFLDPLNKQTDLSEYLLRLITQNVLVDHEYCRRLERHYSMFKEVVNNPQHPLHQKMSPYFDESGPEYRKALSEVTSWRARQRLKQRRKHRR